MYTFLYTNLPFACNAMVVDSILRELTHDKINFYIMPSASLGDKNFMHLNICIFLPLCWKRLIEFIYNVHSLRFVQSSLPDASAWSFYYPGAA